ncbi:MAG: Glucosaminyl phosphatidylinositol (GlcN-PI) nositol acylation protein [Phylliscum demangeonii]|nr:MAG: Glucosaminyl phosphatidylinositol (GlcN-PI) nositol acylation protein [Phylliscum demangeonii]
MAASKSYKTLKEDFVANLPGGDISEINYVTAVAPAAVILWSALQSRLAFFDGGGGGGGGDGASPVAALAVDFLLNCGGILLATTVYAAHPVWLNVLLVAPALLLCVRWRPRWMGMRGRRRRRYRKPAPYSTPTSDPTPALSNGHHHVHGRREAMIHDAAPAPYALRPKAFLTHYRGCMMVATCVAILAVDFPLFPRRFAKVETWGTSLMDLGVGSFVFSAGIVCVRRRRRPSTDNDKDDDDHDDDRLLRRMASSLRHALPLLLLGFIRLLTVKGLDYQEHVTEYGVHWNFFFTLALLPPCAAVFEAAVRHVMASYVLWSLLVGVVYHLLLRYAGLERYMIAAPRTGLLSMNREGIGSFVGYLSIFLAGQSAGTYLLLPSMAGEAEVAAHDVPDGARSSSSSSRLRLVLRAFYRAHRLPANLLGSGIGWAALYQLLAILSPPSSASGSGLASRRLANLQYISWVNAFNSMQLLAFYAIDHVFFPPTPTTTPTPATDPPTTTSAILRAFNQHGLILFALANVLTGAVNLGLDTLRAGTATALAVLLAYLALLTAVALALARWRAARGRPRPRGEAGVGREGTEPVLKSRVE